MTVTMLQVCKETYRDREQLEPTAEDRAHAALSIETRVRAL